MTFNGQVRWDFIPSLGEVLPITDHKLFFSIFSPALFNFVMNISKAEFTSSLGTPLLYEQFSGHRQLVQLFQPLQVSTKSCLGLSLQSLIPFPAWTKGNDQECLSLQNLHGSRSWTCRLQLPYPQPHDNGKPHYFCWPEQLRVMKTQSLVLWVGCLCPRNCYSSQTFSSPRGIPCPFLTKLEGLQLKCTKQMLPTWYQSHQIAEVSNTTQWGKYTVWNII